MKRVKGDGQDFQPAVVLLVALLAATLLLGLRARETASPRSDTTAS
jgi:hypothetical protein